VTALLQKGKVLRWTGCGLWNATNSLTI